MIDHRSKRPLSLRDSKKKGRLKGATTIVFIGVISFSKGRMGDRLLDGDGVILCRYIEEKDRERTEEETPDRM
jgi:hypothetical protein